VTQPVTVYIGLGSNLLDPERQLVRACKALAAMSHSKLRACSPFYRSTAIGPSDQPDYLNGVAEMETALEPHDLLDALQAIEVQQGRVRSTQRWGPRTLDLDILLYGEQVISDPQLVVPHPELGARNFVLYPLHDVAGDDLVIPELGSLASLLAACSREGLELLSR
jgi:2-amino-4-hydroxy-6-hydroxymethyldihydropteridine diphosphokinase